MRLTPQQTRRVASSLLGRLAFIHAHLSPHLKVDDTVEMVILDSRPGNTTYLPHGDTDLAWEKCEIVVDFLQGLL